MDLILLLAELRKQNIRMDTREGKLLLSYPAGYLFPDSLRVCVERHKQALIDIVHAEKFLSSIQKEIKPPTPLKPRKERLSPAPALAPLPPLKPSHMPEIDDLSDWDNVSYFDEDEEDENHV